MARAGHIADQDRRPALSSTYINRQGLLAEEYRPRTWLFVVLFSLLGVLLFARLGSPPIYILDEAKNAQCAREMMQDQTLIVPTFNGQLRTDKPPLHYYFMMVAYRVFGTSSFAARFFSGVMGLLTIAITTLFANRLLGKGAALLTTGVLCSSSHFMFEFRLAVPDPYFIFFTVTGLLCGFVWLSSQRQRYLYLAAASLALASLAKGPVAVVLPAISFIAFALYRRKWKTVFTPHLLVAALLFGLIALPWYLLVDHATGGAWTQSFFMDHNVNRFSSTREGHGGFFLLPLLVLLLGLLPFSAFAGAAIKIRKDLSDDAIVFSLIVLSVVVLFFSFSATQLPNYALPAYPFAAIIMGHYLNIVTGGNVKLPRYPLYIIAVFLCVLPVAVHFILSSEAQTKSAAGMAHLMFIPALLYVAMLLNRRPLSGRVMVYGIMFIYFAFNVLVLQVIYPRLYRNNPVSKTLDIVASAPKVVAFGHYNPAFNFYLAALVEKTSANEIELLTRTIPGTVVLTSSSQLQQLDSLHLKIIAREHDLFEDRETFILSR